MSIFIHPTAIVDQRAIIGDGTKIWVNAQIREFSVIGENCVISKDVYIDVHTHIGNGCKIQNGVYVYDGVTLEDEVFVGPNVTFTNDLFPRANNKDWKIVPTIIKKGASIGAGAVIICGITIGEGAMIGAGSVVTHNVAPWTLIMGNPANEIRNINKE